MSFSIETSTVVTVLEIRKKLGNLREKERGKSGKSQGNLTGCPNVKVSSPLKFILIAASAKMLYQEVMKNSLRSGKVSEKGEMKKVATY